jgi:TPR repeat protein
MAYAIGQGLPKDYTTAATWYRKAAEQGQAKAQFLLGMMYARGQGVPQDYATAHMWFNLSASRATDDRVRGEALKSRDGVAAKVTPDQIAEAQRMAREWKPK